MYASSQKPLGMSPRHQEQHANDELEMRAQEEIRETCGHHGRMGNPDCPVDDASNNSDGISSCEVLKGTLETDDEFDPH